MTRIGLVMAAVIVLSGCTQWVRIETRPFPAGSEEPHVPVVRDAAGYLRTIPLGTDVRLTLSNEALDHLEELTGTRWGEITGRLLQWEPEVRLSEVPVGLDPGDVVQIDVRRVDEEHVGPILLGTVTGLAVAGAGIYWLYAVFIDRDDNFTAPPPPPLPPR